LYGALPTPLLALNPAFDLDRDRRFGPAGRFDTVTDLLDLPQLFDRKARAKQFEQSSDGVKKRDLQLLFRVNGRKSLDQAFYDSRVRLALARKSALDLFQYLALEARFDAQHLPQGAGEALNNRGSIGFSTDLQLNQRVINVLSFSGEYGWSRNRFTAPGQAVERSTENTFTISALADGRLANGLLRAALWTDSSILSGDGGSYRRLLTRIGYGKEIPLHRRKRFHKITPVELGEECWTAYEVEPNTNEPTLGLEVLAGAGRAWGSIPAHARFSAGRVPGQFLHDDFIAESLRATPAGPLLRSLGEAQGTVTPSDGGTSFWHANFNVAFPVPGWSRPLIPHEWVTASPLRPDEGEFVEHVPPGDPVCRDLKSVMKTLVGVSGINLMVNQQARGFLTEEQQRDLRLRSVDERTADEEARLAAAEAALASAKREVRPEIEELFARDILPVTSFIADHANIFAVKPLFMFDVARLNDRTGGRTRWSMGGGLQLDVVLARFEFGYLAAISRAPGDTKGNFIARLVLKRFF
jgi:hypothetical protein